MIKNQNNLKQVLQFVENKKNIEFTNILKQATISAVLLSRPELLVVSTSVATLLGKTVGDLIQKTEERLSTKTEDTATENYKRCQLTKLLLVKLSFLRVVDENFDGQERMLSSWKIQKHFDETLVEQLKTIENRDSEIINSILNNEVQITSNELKKEYIESLTNILEVNEDEVDTFKDEINKKFDEINESYELHIRYKSEMYKSYSNSKNMSNEIDLIRTDLMNIMGFITSYKKLYMTVSEFEEQLINRTNPSISLDFFDYKEDEFSNKLIESIDQNVIYVKGKTREEVFMYVLYLMKTKKILINKEVYVVNSLENWNDLSDKCEGKVLIPNFNAQVIEPIKNNITIIGFGDEDITGNNSPIILKDRLIRNMRDALHNEVDDWDIAEEYIRKSNGLYASFKRLIFEGKLSNPLWESENLSNYTTALLLTQWTECDGDKDVVANISGLEYEEYYKSVQNVISTEDPLLLKYEDYGNTIIKLTNIEEAWEIIFNNLTEEIINRYKEVALMILIHDIDPKYSLSLDKQYMAGVLTGKPDYSEKLKEGFRKSLIMLAKFDDRDNHFGIKSTQLFVDDIVKNVLSDINTQERWYACAEYLPDFVEASPEVVTNMLEKEVANKDSSFWSLFDNKSTDAFFGHNYYTHIIWTIEKLLCYNDYSIRAMKLLAKLEEHGGEYKLANTPMNTLSNSLTAWVHYINMSLDDKLMITEFIVKNSSIGWSLLEELLPTRYSGRTVSSMSTPKYRTEEFIFELKYKNEVYDTYKKYLEIAISEAETDVLRWKTIIKKFSFFQFEFEDKVISGTKNAIDRCNDDALKFELKEETRRLIYNNRYFKDSDWAAVESQISIIEKELFDYIKFENEAYDYIDLFTNYHPHFINPIDYKDDYDGQNNNIKNIRIATLKKLNDDSQDRIFNIIEHIGEKNKNGSEVISFGSIMASQIHNYRFNSSYFEKLLELDNKLYVSSYVNELLIENGLNLFKKILREYDLNAEIKLQLFRTVDVSNELFEMLSIEDDLFIEEYWSKWWNRRVIKDDDVKNVVWKKLIEHHNYNMLLDLLQDNFQDDLSKHIEVLDLISKNNDRFKSSSMHSYYIEKAFKYIYQNDGSLDSKDLELMFRLEWFYFNILTRIKAKYIYAEFNERPDFIIELISYALKRSSDIDLKDELTKERKQLARNAYSILDKLKSCPCIEEDGSIISEKISKWIERYLQLAIDNDQQVICERILGECLSKSPLGNDGIFPHESVREVYELFYTESIERGFELSIFNSRGVVSFSAGASEKELSANYKEYSRKCKIEYSRMSKTLKNISDNLFNDSINQRKRGVFDL